MQYDLLLLNSDIDEKLIHQVLQIRRDGIADRLIIVLTTLGGDPFAAYRTMQHLGALYKTIEAVVPDKAMSAGTLMCMGADKIYMFEGSCLGPLDLQVSHPGDGGMISTLDIRQSTYNIFGLTTTITKQLYDQAINELELGKSLAANVAHDAAVELLKPMIDKIDPYHLHESYRAALVGRKFAGILLASRMMREKQPEALEIARILAEDSLFQSNNEHEIVVAVTLFWNALACLAEQLLSVFDRRMDSLVQSFLGLVHVLRILRITDSVSDLIQLVKCNAWL